MLNPISLEQLIEKINSVFGNEGFIGFDKFTITGRYKGAILTLSFDRKDKQPKKYGKKP